MVIHWSVTYKRHRGGIYSLSSTALLRGVLRPGEAARDQQQQISHPSDFPLPFSPPQRQAAQPALPATEIFPGFASTVVSFLGWALGTCLVSGQERLRVDGEGERSICSSCCRPQGWASLGRARRKMRVFVFCFTS